MLAAWNIHYITAYLLGQGYLAAAPGNAIKASLNCATNNPPVDRFSLFEFTHSSVKHVAFYLSLLMRAR